MKFSNSLLINFIFFIVIRERTALRLIKLKVWGHIEIKRMTIILPERSKKVVKMTEMSFYAVEVDEISELIDS